MYIGCVIYHGNKKKIPKSKRNGQTLPIQGETEEADIAGEGSEVNYI